MSEFELYLAKNLLSHEEIDWEEDRVTLRILSQGEHSAEIEASEWGKVLSAITSNIVGKLLRKYDDSEEQLLKLYSIIEKSYSTDIRKEIDELTSN